MPCHALSETKKNLGFKYTLIIYVILMGNIHNSTTTDGRSSEFLVCRIASLGIDVPKTQVRSEHFMQWSRLKNEIIMYFHTNFSFLTRSIDFSGMAYCNSAMQKSKCKIPVRVSCVSSIASNAYHT